MGRPSTKVKKEEEPKVKEVEVTQEMLDTNPEWAEKGIAVGDFIEVDESEETNKEDKKETKASGKKMKGAMVVLKNGSQYIRTYSADQSEELASFLSKDAAYSAVEASSVEEFSVTYKVTNPKTGVVSQETKLFTDGAEAIEFANTRKAVVIVK